MGPGSDATESDIAVAFELGKLVAENNWATLTGGVKTGVMDSALRGAKERDGFTIGIIPRQDSEVSDHVDIPIMTDMGSARNNINVLSSTIIVVIGISPGTASEISLALQDRANKHVILLNATSESITFFKMLRPDRVHVVDSAEEAIKIMKNLI